MKQKKIISVMKRYELKYALSKDQLGYFMEQIGSFMKIDKYGKTSIASICFDTPDFRLITKSIEKPKYKEKMRLRGYGLVAPDKPTPSATKEGSGVGLSIAKEIINLHKGTIKIDKNNTSLTFIITF